jgi:flagellar biosynthetic protein FlhB
VSDAQEKTEQATDKRMKEVRAKGQLSTSKDLVSWVAVGAGVVMIPSTINGVKDSAAATVVGFRDIIAHPEPDAAVEVLRSQLQTIIPALTPMFIAVVIAIVAATAVQGGIHLKRPTPKFDQFDPVAGI